VVVIRQVNRNERLGNTVKKLTRGSLVTALAMTLLVSISAQSSFAKTTTLRFSGVSVGQDSLVKAIDAFEKANPNIKVKATFAGTEQYQVTIRTQLASGTAPDIFFVQPGNGNPTTMRQLAPPGYLRDLSSMPFSKMVPKGADIVTAINGKRYFLPMTVAGIGVIYNEKAVADAKAVLPKTWTEVLQFCDAAKQAGKVAFALGAQTLWTTQLINYALVPTLVFRVDPKFDEKLTSGKASFAGSPGWKSAFLKYQDMLKKGCFNADPNGTSFETSMSLVAKGDALAIVQVTAILPAIQGMAPNSKFGMFALPATDNPKETWMPAAVGGGFGINSKTKNLAAAQKFINFMAQPETMNEYAKANAAFPAIPNKSFIADPALKFMDTLVKAGKTYPFMDQMWPNAKIQPAQYDGIQRMLSGTGSVPDILSAMDDAARQP